MNESQNNLNNSSEENLEKTNAPETVDETVEVDDPSKKEKKTSKRQKEEEYCPSIFDKPDYSYEEKAKKKHTNKQVVNILITLLVCVGLGFGIWGAVKFLPKNDPSETESSAAEEGTTYIYDYYSYLSDFSDVADAQTFPESTDAEGYAPGLTLGGISQIDVKNPDTQFVLKPAYVKEMQLNSETLEEEEKTMLRWNVDSVANENIDGVKFNTGYTEFVVQDLLRLSYKSVYAENRNDKTEKGNMTFMQECGFDKPRADLSITFADGSKLNVLVGSETPEGSQDYVTVISEASDKDVLGKPIKDEKIYITDAENTAFYFKDILYYVEIDLLTAPKDETTYNDEGDEIADKYFTQGALTGFDSLKITGKNTDAPISFDMVDVELPPYTTPYLMTTPRRQCASIEAIDELLEPMASGFRAAYCLSMKATDADKAKYGINNPTYQVTYVIKNVTNVLTVGNQITDGTYKGHYAVMVNGNPSIMVASADLLKFITKQSIDYSSDEIYSCSIEDVRSINMVIKGTTYNFVLNHGETNEDLVVKLNGKTTDTEKFRELYREILSITARGDNPHVTDATNTNETLGITFNYLKYSKTDKIAFYPYTDRRYSCLLNGSGDWTMYSSTVDKIITLVEALKV